MFARWKSISEQNEMDLMKKTTANERYVLQNGSIITMEANPRDVTRKDIEILLTKAI